MKMVMLAGIVVVLIVVVVWMIDGLSSLFHSLSLTTIWALFLKDDKLSRLNKIVITFL
jgi:hypothetical protein